MNPPFSTSVSPALSRRGLLTGAAATGLAAATVAGVPDLATAKSGGLHRVTPLWSEAVRRSYGVCAHPNFQHSVYGSEVAWLEQLGELGAGYFRGFYCPGLHSTKRAIRFCRRHGLKWLMLVSPEDWSVSESELKKVLAHIRDHAADICIGIEGPNEPNHGRGGGRVPSNWVARTVHYQKIIYRFVQRNPELRHVTVVGPSLQLGASNPYPDFVKLAEAGIARYMDVSGLHSYPGGMLPDNNLNERIRWARRAWGRKPVWITETGYTNAMGSHGGHRPVPDSASAVYGPRTLLEGARRGINVARFELLDDPDPGNRNQEANFGLIRCPSVRPSTWTRKPEFDTLQKLLTGLADHGRHFTPDPIKLSVTGASNVRWVVVGKRNGDNRLLAYHDTPVYDARRRTKVRPKRVTVTVTDRRGSREIEVGPRVKSIRLR